MARSRYHRAASAGLGVAKGVGRRLAALAAATTAAGQLLPGSVGLAAPREGFGSTSGSLSSPSAATSSSSTQNSGGLVLKVSRQSSGVALIIEGTGPSPQLVQSSSSNGWQAQLTTGAPMALQQGPQRLSLPEFGLSQVTLTGGGNSFQLDVLPAQGLPLARPVISADGRNLIVTFAAAPQASSQTLRPNINQPGTVPQATYAPPLQPRAVAPPLGDMAIGTMMLRNSSFINLRGPRITMTLRNASAKDVLMSLARIGNYGFVYVDESSSSGAVSSIPANQPPASGALPVSDFSTKVNISFVNEDYSRAVNAVLLSSGLSARLEGSMILAGKGIHGKSFGPRLSKIYRLNQVSPESAADYLANLGASVTKTNTISTSVSMGETQDKAVQGAPSSSTTTSSRTTSVEVYGAAMGPLIGLQATTDSRLDTITMIGDPSLVAIAEQYLKQLDLRQRQVALTVRLLDVNINNDSTLKNSFAFRWGNNLVLSQDGSLASWVNSLGPGINQKPQDVPQDANFANKFVAYLESSNTKVLAAPTLILSENPEPIRGGREVAASSDSGTGDSSASSSSEVKASIGRPYSNESFVTVGNQVITNYEFQPSTPTQGAVCKAELSTAGLTFGARVSKIDDNGYVTFSLSPQVSAVVSTAEGSNSCGRIDILSVRRLDSGTVRVRDGQTLILTGVISDEDIQQVTKWPILGDIPVIGQFFRGSRGTRRKRELVIMVTPRIVREDNYADPYGYGYRPSSQEAREFMSGM